MPEASPLLTDDPTDIGGYHIVGRLGVGSKSTVYLAKRPGEEHVAVKLLHSDLAGADRFLAKVDELRQVSAFCTAQVIETGMAGDQPYVVSEYIDGPTLKQAVEVEGPLRGPALHRLAIGTMTALVAIHQAGIAHREFGPRSVLLGPDGPRVIDFGIAEALNAGVSSTTRSVGSPAYLTPEQLDGAPVGPSSDMFAWGATMLFAASGRDPFDAGSMSATINKILRDEPDLSVLDGDLLSLVGECLSKDPARRPSAGEALLRLVGHSQILATAESIAAAPAPQGAAPQGSAPQGAGPWPLGDLLAAPPPDSTARVTLPPPGRAARRRRSLLLVAGALAIALASGGAVYALVPRTTTAPVAAPAPAPTPVPAPSASVIEASPSPPPPATKDVTLPGSKITLHENPADPFQLNAYFVQDIKKKLYQSYTRDTGADTFRKIAENAEFGDPAVSPDGKWATINPWLKFAASSYDYIVFHNRATGEKFSIDTLKQPLRGLSGVWSRDSKRFLLTFYEFDLKKKTQYPAGFVVVDVATRKATVVKTDDQRDGYGNFDWSPDGAYVVGAYEKKGKPRFGLRFRDLNGNVVRTLPWVGLIPGPGIFSRSGRSFFTYCPPSSDAKAPDTVCVWNLDSGNRTATIPVWSDDISVHGWWDEHHLVVLDTRKDVKKYVVIDFHGKVKRTLVDVPKKDSETVFVRFGWK
ncbi:serine/threonine protein kinase [Sphaerisporangium dianthi]|uniref:non-specific serine/threonine protein kinase n=1 Tax=Sphaerisporangium dianthi TaxID=1436120 RepID=A0ABV9CFR3_9ACTN